jgi:hypothetical protein
LLACPTKLLLTAGCKNEEVLQCLLSL